MGGASTEFIGLRQPSAWAFEDLTTLRIFVRTVEIGNFSEVARRIGANPAMVSKRIANLENKIGQRLLNRNTRRLMVTEAGQRLYDHCMRALIELDQAAEEMSNMQDKASGLLRMTAPAMLGEAVIAPQLPQFLQQNPLLSLDINFSLEKVDLFKARIDVAVRIADSVDPGLVAIKLAPYRRVFCVAPQYIAAKGAPELPADLMDHNCLITRGSVLNTRWPVRLEGEIGNVPVKGNLVTDNGHAARLACLAGLGVMMAPRWLLEEDIRAGRLVEVLADYVPDNRSVYALLLQRTGFSAKLQIAIDFLKRCFASMN
ncbi:MULTISPECIES: LysR family transcriptional regulator [Bordetella]|uniref:LysR family transcriptional regulator n=1 Tax=Bordetella genomosp. 6 TaxID=463024 RepID=A0ABX4FBF7_9BORD|nr:MULTISPECIES: LysR family transcriptional regulator [Bordetella]AOB26123.1 LysR family transcriptional regulator [Bordetella bronchiseptica]ARP77591.1 LysR family transcriptional regulator [Bordetella genomosp. 6]AZW43410.1 LysR family transcriptional regulator [Bordetella bronchiseptica]KCV65685.1 LysR substrate-binding domain protein [Bordetella bronchiseptica 99-R-0433]MBN3268845.1 LysR family transcriptional regulator [Bordetella bronchiseptica]